MQVWSNYKTLSLSIIKQVFTFFLLGFHFLLQAGEVVEIPNFGVNLGNLKMYVYVPKNLPNERIPLVVALHGCSQSAQKIADQSGWNDLADRYQFIVVYPQQKYTNNPSGCFNWFRKNDTEKGKGEVSSIQEMVDFTLKNYAIDPQNVHIYGLSAGAAMAVSVLATNPTGYKSGAVFAGAPYKMANNAVEGAKAMLKPIDKTPVEWASLIPMRSDSTLTFPTLIIGHGTKDAIVNIRSSFELMEQWTAVTACDTIATFVDSTYQENPRVSKALYMNSNREIKVIFYLFKDIPHALPVDPGTKENQGGETGFFAVDIDFHSTYYVAKDFGLISE